MTKDDAPVARAAGAFAMRAVHPRACGERPGSGDLLAANNGSSPRVRGTVHYEGLPAALQRFIPARAGNGVVKDEDGDRRR